MSYKQWDIIVVPFPFVNSLKSKPRPVLILNNAVFSSQTEHYLGAMITSSGHDDWFGDVAITDLTNTGLTTESKVRFKVFTLDQRIIKKRIGTLSKNDISKVMSKIGEIF